MGLSSSSDPAITHLKAQCLMWGDRRKGEVLLSSPEQMQPTQGHGIGFKATIQLALGQNSY